MAPRSIFAVAVLTVASHCLSCGVGRAEESFDFFEKRIRPVLAKHCYECHSAKSRPVQAGLLLDTREGSRRGGDSGPAVVPGKPSDSLLLDALRHETFEMPPQGKLAADIVDDFAKWIADGAPDPRDSAKLAASDDRRADASFWSYQTIKQPTPPNVEDVVWQTANIDRFIRARLAAQGLRPAQIADREVLMRRLTFDLTGLPPTREQRERFLSSSDKHAYASLVDSLLNSPAFGERWARHWLDVARFAESTGGGRTKIFDSAWRYRDYVIRSFNSDKPFDRFAQEQVAGDLLPHANLESEQDGLIATGFLVLGPINYELQDKELLRMEVIDEQLDVMGRALLGLSIGCARCHDHKFDRFSINDYYSLAGVFHSTRSLTPGNVSGFVMRPLPLTADKQAEIDAGRVELAALNQELAAINKKLKQSPAASVGSRVNVASLAGIAVDNDTAKRKGEWAKSVSISGFIGDEYIHDSNAGVGAKSVEYTTEIPATGDYDIRISYTASGNRASNTPVDVWSPSVTATRSINQRRKPPIDGRFISLGVYRLIEGETAKVTIRNDGADGVVIADCVQWLAKDGQKSPPKPMLTKQEQLQQQAKAAQVATLVKRKQQLEKQLKKVQAHAVKAPMIMSVEDQEKPADFYICVRGNVHQKGESTPRGFPLSLSGAQPITIPPQASGRLQLAQWLAHPKNPRTSRVIVNRVWRHLFGVGIVRTPDDFGPMGDRPTHPELLDFLAAELMEDGWSLKRLIRRIVLSKTYQLSAAADPALLEADPDNRLFGRHEPRRLDAEALRDAMLTVSGVLDQSQGGKTLKPNTRSEFGYSFDNVQNRRSVYVPILRNALHDFLVVFDLADPNLVSGDRSTSTLPSQSLLLMNSPEMRRLSKAAAQRLLGENYADDEARMNSAFIRFLGRRPTSRERELADGYLRSAESDEARQAKWAQLCHSLLASIDFRYVK